MTSLPHLTPCEQAVRYAASEAATHYDSTADLARIGRAVDLILAGHVTLLPTGEADVRNQTGHGSYHVNGACQCPDFARAEAGRCKHRYAKAILKRPHRILAAAWYATHEDAQGLQVSGIAFVSRDGDDWLFLPADQVEGWHCDLASLVLLGQAAAGGAAAVNADTVRA
jgi:hypothetical protein